MLLLSSLSVFIINILLLIIAIKYSSKIGYNVTTRKAGVMPVLGGACIMFSWVLGILIFYNAQIFTDNKLFGLFVLLVPTIILGLIDDRVSLNPKSKIFGFILIACVAIVLSLFKYELNLYYAAIFAVILFFFSNAFNLSDNEDGHCASISFAIIICLAWLNNSVILLMLCASLFAFLLLNRAPAKIYLGDTGSLALGTICTYYAFQYPELSFGLTVLLLIPLYDTVSVILLRKYRKQSILIGGHDHFTHRLIKAGLNMSIVNMGAIAITILMFIISWKFKQPYLAWFLGIGLLLIIDILCYKFSKK